MAHLVQSKVFLPLRKLKKTGGELLFGDIVHVAYAAYDLKRESDVVHKSIGNVPENQFKTKVSP